MILDKYDPIGIGLSSNVKSRPDSSWAENVSAVFRSGLLIDSIMSDNFALQAVWHDTLLPGMESAGLTVRDPTDWLGTSDTAGGGQANYEWRAQRLYDQALALERDNPGTFDPDILSLMSLDATASRGKEIKLEAQADLEDVTARGQGFVPASGRFVGGIGAALGEATQDPVQGALMFAGNARKILTFAATQAVIGGGIEALRQPQVAENYRSLGLQYTSEQYWRSIAYGAAGSAIFATGVRVGVPAAGRAVGAAYRAGERAAVGRDVSMFTRALDQAEPDMFKALSMEQLRSIPNAYQAAGVRLGSEALAALDIVDAQLSAKTSNPGLPQSVHAEILSTVDAAVANNKIPDLGSAEPPVVIPRETLGQSLADNLDGFIYKFDPRELLVDAKTFQFKEGGDEFGVTDAYRYVTQWDKSLAGTITVYQFADGRMFIADGHQRMGMALRVMAADPSQQIALYGILYREVDGITPKEAMVRAAFTNIVQGTGSVIDAAKIARMDPARFQGMIGKTLSPVSAMVRDANGLMSLGNDAWGAIVNKVIKPEYGAIVGQILNDKPALQTAAIDIINKIKPDNADQARLLVRQVREADYDVSVQESLFGDEMIVETLLKERMQILDKAIKQLRQDRAAFSNLVRNAETVEVEGNVLDRSANQRRLDADAEAIARVEILANRKGPLSDALTAAARLYKDTGRPGTATDQFVGAIRRAVADGDFDGIDGGTSGRIVEDPTPRPRSEIESEPVLDGFDEPTGHGPVVEQRVDDMTRDMFGAEADAEVGEPTLPPQGSIGELKNLIDSGADLAIIDNHPAVLKAVEDMASRKQTIDAENFGTDAWHEERIYIIDGQQVKGTENALPLWEKQADELAWKEQGLTPEPVATNRQATIILGPPAAGKSTIANDLAVFSKSAILDADEIKKAIPGFNGGIGAAAVHEESSVLAKLLQNAILDGGKNVIIPKVGHSASGISNLISLLKDRGYTVNLVDMSVSPTNAKLRMYGRFISRGRLIPPAYLDDVGTLPSQTYNILKSEGVADGFAQIDNNGALGSTKPVIDKSGDDFLSGSSLDLDAGGGAVARAADGYGTEAVGQIPIQEEGGQLVVPGAEPEGGPLDDVARAQQDLFADVDLDMEIPSGARLTGENVMEAETMTLRDVKRMLDEEDDFIDRLGKCAL
jgi:hypothetical protein